MADRVPPLTHIDSRDLKWRGTKPSSKARPVMTKTPTRTCTTQCTCGQRRALRACSRTPAPAPPGTLQ